MERKAESEDLFRSVYEEVYPVLTRILYRYTYDLEATEDICQEAFIRYFEHMDQAPTSQEARYWLIRVAKNLGANYRKRKGRERSAYERFGHEPVGHEEGGEERTLRAETSRAVRAALERLPKKAREVLVLKEYGELSYAEIGEVLGITEANVKVRVYRARRKLMGLVDIGDVYVP